jgi:ABC-type dipeptide/oligopeptide/nickel transport system permease subunit
MVTVIIGVLALISSMTVAFLVGMVIAYIPELVKKKSGQDIR